MRTRRAALGEFLHAEYAGSVVLLVATAAALVWANLPQSSSYETFWTSELDLGVDLSRAAWIGDGLMTLFFLVVGLEIRREVVSGELQDRRRAALPAIAALGGMVVPALLYVAIAGADGSDGWGIPMATDIALAVGVVHLLGSRVPSALSVFLLALAIVDDIGAIVVIALFYTEDVEVAALIVALATTGAMLAARAIGVRSLWLYGVLGVVLWLTLHDSGVHPTIAGVVVAFVLPVGDNRVERSLHPWTSLLIVPLFALSHAGVSLRADALEAAFDSRITWAVIVGLVVGKLAGVSLFSWLAVRVGAGRLPEGVRGRHVVGAAALAGIGFTVSMFITGLAFADAARQQEAIIGILAASVVAAALGLVTLRR